MTFAGHVRALAKAFDVLIREDPDRSPEDAGAGWLREDSHLPLVQRRKCARFRSVTDETSYAVALHELGHCVAPMGQLEFDRDLICLRNARLQIEEERAAWEWARHMALDWTVAMDQVRLHSLKSYELRWRYLETGKEQRYE